MLEALTPELLETKERVGILDMFEALTLRRLRGQHAPERTVDVRAEFDAAETRRRRELDEAIAKRLKEDEVYKQQRIKEAFEAIEKRGGPQAVQAVKAELNRRVQIARMQQAMKANQFVFPGAFGSSTTNTSSTYGGTTNTFFFR